MIILIKDVGNNGERKGSDSLYIIDKSGSPNLNNRPRISVETRETCDEYSNSNHII